jgi:predicted phage-related endonuclease
VKVLMTPAQFTADRARWKQIRRKGITASEIASIMRVPGAFSSPPAVYWNKAAGDEIPDTGQMAMGRWLEPYVSEQYSKRFPLIVTEPGPLICHGRRRWQMATPDLLAWGPGEGDLDPARPDLTVQIKTTRTWEDYGDEPDGEIPPAYLAQCLWEADIAGVRRAQLAVAHRDSGQVRVYDIGVDEPDAQHDLEIMRAEAIEFRKRVESRIPPPMDWHPASRDALKRVYAGAIEEAVVIPRSTGRRLRTRKRALDAAEQAYRLAENEVRARLRTATRAISDDGELYAARSVYPNRRVSVTLLRERYPAIAAECTIEADDPVDKLLVKFPKEDPDDGA